jgi:hypothetical protein
VHLPAVWGFFLWLALVALVASTGLLAIVWPEPAPARVGCPLAWRPFPSPLFAHASLNGLAATGPHDLWAAGNGYSGSAPTQVIVEHWDGRRRQGAIERASLGAIRSSAPWRSSTTPRRPTSSTRRIRCFATLDRQRRVTASQ